MIRLLNKELRLAMHPVSPVFLLLSAMLLIPDYPYYVVFFYTGLGLFFTFLSGREHQDLFFTLLLPVGKSDVVKGRFMLVVLMEMLQLLTAAVFALLRGVLRIAPNAAGMDANVSLFALALMILGAFNLVFLPMVYKNPNRVGVAFVAASTVEFLLIFLAEGAVHIVPYFRDVLDTPDPMYLLQKGVLLLAGMVCFALTTWKALRMSIRNFDRIDM